MSLKNKVALVTGGSRGIGRSVAIQYAREGALVALNYLSNRASANEVVKTIKELGSEAIAVKADVADKRQVEMMVQDVVKKWQRIDILVNNAGVAPFAGFFETTEEVLDRTMDVNCKGIFLVSQAVARVMAEKGGGKIINITSVSGVKATDPLQTAYCTSKGAANMLTKAMAVALAPYKINVNAILPGTIETDLNREILEDPATKESTIKATPLKSLGRPEDVAQAAVYLGSDAANWVTGALIVVDGGFIA